MPSRHRGVSVAAQGQAASLAATWAGTIRPSRMGTGDTLGRCEYTGPVSSPNQAGPRVFLVGGSPSSASRSSRVLEIVRRDLTSRGIEAELLNLRDLPPEPMLSAHNDDPAIRRSIELLQDAAGVVLGCPIYKSSLSGLMKVWLDLLPQFALRDKVVLPLATGGSLSSVLAIDYGIRPILQSMGTHHVLPGLFILDSWLTEDADGADTLSENPQEKLDELVDAFVEAL